MAGPESLSGGLVPRVQHRSVSKDHPHALQFLVAVGVGSAAHSRSVVHHDSADHTASDRGRIRAEFPTIRLQDSVHPRPYDSRFEGYLGSVLRNHVSFPVLSRHDQHGIADSLTRKAGSGGTKSHRDIKLRCRLKDLRDFFLIGRPDDNLRHKPVETSVGAPGEAPYLIGVECVLGHEFPYFLKET